MDKPEVFGKYLFVERVSVGGMAEVFKAVRVGLSGFQKVLAIKRVLPHIAEDEDFVRMFVDEANIAGQLHHANIAQIYDLGRVGQTPFIAMEYVEGRDLRAVFERVKKNRIDIPVHMAASVAVQILAGLDYAHRKTDGQGRPLHIVHRDVSPPNVLIGYSGEVKLVDFGIAKAAKKASKTQAGVLKGKFGYMSPEQVRGMPVDGRSDVFSVGIVLWEMLTKQRLFVGDTDFATLEKVRGMEIEKPSLRNREVPPELDAIVMQALQREVDKRFPSAQHMQHELQRYLYSQPTLYTERQLAEWMGTAFREEIEQVNARMREIEKIDLAYYGIDPESLSDLGVQSLKTEQVSARAAEREEPVTVPRPPSGVSVKRLGLALAAAWLAMMLVAATLVGRTPSRLHTLGQDGPRGVLTVLANVEEASVVYHEREICKTPCRLADFPAGEQTLIVRREGLLADELAFTLKPGEQKTLSAELYKSGEVAGVVLMRTKPSGAELKVSGRAEGCTTPCSIRHLEAGVPLELTLRLAGFETKTLPLTLKRHEFRSETVTLKPETPSLMLVTEPAQAAVWVDGKDTGKKTPVRLDHLVAGEELALRFVLAGFRPQELRAVPQAEEEQHVEVELEDLRAESKAKPEAVAASGDQGWLNVFSDPPAQIYIDGRPTGRRAPALNLAVKPGRHELKLINPDANIHDVSTVEIKAGGVTKVRKVFPKD